MSTSVTERAALAQAFAVSAATMLFCCAFMGLVITILAWADLAWVGEGGTDLLSGVTALLMGAFLGLIGGPINSPIAVLTGTLLYLWLGRTLTAQECSSGVHRRLHWLGGGALIGALVTTIMLIEEPILGMANERFPLLYAPGMITGMTGMVFWRALIVRLPRSPTC